MDLRVANPFVPATERDSPVIVDADAFVAVFADAVAVLFGFS